MGVCTAFVFAALVEFTFVNYLWRKTSTSTRQYLSARMFKRGLHENGNDSRQITTPMNRVNNPDAVELNLVSPLQFTLEPFNIGTLTK